MFLYGGHTVAVDPSDKSETETVHDDMWALDLLTYQVGVLQRCKAHYAEMPLDQMCKRR